MFYIWQRSRAKQDELFWTGITWTSVRQFGQLYTFHQALRIVEQRFQHKYTGFVIRRESYFVEREKKKRKGKFNTSKEKGK